MLSLMNMINHKFTQASLVAGDEYHRIREQAIQMVDDSVQDDDALKSYMYTEIDRIFGPSRR